MKAVITPQDRDAMRALLGDCMVKPKSPEFAEAADLLNDLIPAMVNRLTDEEIDEYIEQLCSHLLYSLTTG